MDVAAVEQAEEENVYELICHKHGDEMMEGCADVEHSAEHHRLWACFRRTD